MKKTLYAIAFSTLIVPVIVNAQTIDGGIKSLGDLIKAISTNIFDGLITLFATAALAAFFFGMVRFIWASREGKDTEITQGKQFMLWSVIALFVMFSIWGIVKYGQTIFGFTATTIDIPTVNIRGGAGTKPTSDTGLPEGRGAVGASCTNATTCATGLVCTNLKCAQPGAGGGGGTCDSIGSQSTCVSNSSCFWDTNRGCETKTGSCSYPDFSTCNNNSACYWDEDNGCRSR